MQFVTQRTIMYNSCMDKKKKETGFEMLARLIKSESDDIREEIENVRQTSAKHEDVASLYRRMAIKEDIRELQKEMESGFENVKQELLGVMKPMEEAQDRNSLAIVDHEARLIRMETK